MTATILPFPPRPAGSLSALARAADARWPGVNAPMVGVAIEMLDQDAGEFHAKVRGILEQGAEGLLAEIDRAMAETVADLAILTAAVDQARETLRAAILGTRERIDG